MSDAFGLSDNYTHSGILQTCNTIFKETMPVALACMHISITYYISDHERLSRTLKVLLASMRQPQGAYLSVLTCMIYLSQSNDTDDIGRLINRTGIRIGCLVLCTVTKSAYLGLGKYFVTALDRLDHKPAKVEWTHLHASRSDHYEIQRREFNKAAEIWHAKLAKVKAADLNARLPLLRDFLPQYFEESAD
jgi:hypothetical protein